MILAAVLEIISAIRAVEGGVESFMPIIASLHAGGVLSDADVAKIKSDGEIADDEYDANLVLARKRLAVE